MQEVSEEVTWLFFEMFKTTKIWTAYLSNLKKLGTSLQVFSVISTRRW